MFLLVAATEQEMAPVRGLAPKAGFDFLVSGVGPVEAAFQLTRYLSTVSIPVSGVINFGVAGAYLVLVWIFSISAWPTGRSLLISVFVCQVTSSLWT